MQAETANDFIGQADRICQDSQRRLDRAQRVPTRTPKDAERQVEDLIAVSRKALSALRDLQPPAERRAGYRRYLRERARALRVLEVAREAAAARDPSAYLRAQRRVSSGAAARLRLAREVGLRDCSRPSVTFGAE